MRQLGFKEKQLPTLVGMLFRPIFSKYVLIDLLIYIGKSCYLPLIGGNFVTKFLDILSVASLSGSQSDL